MAGEVEETLMRDMQEEGVKSTDWEENGVVGPRPEFLLLPVYCDIGQLTAESSTYFI
jgi:hypothetical protein